MSARVDEVTTRSSRARRPLGKPCRSCGSTNTWVELRREPDQTLPGAAGEWPYAVCQSCGHAARGQRKAPAQHASLDTPRVDPDAAASPETTEKPDGTPDQRQATRRGRPPRPKATDERVEGLLRAAGYNRAITPEVLEEHRRFTTHAGKAACLAGRLRWLC